MSHSWLRKLFNVSLLGSRTLRRRYHSQPGRRSYKATRTLFVEQLEVRTVPSVTIGKGNNNISADSFNGAAVTLTDAPIVTEGAHGDMASGTLVLNAPSGFSFDTSASPSIAVTHVAGTGT